MGLLKDFRLNYGAFDFIVDENDRWCFWKSIRTDSGYGLNMNCKCQSPRKLLDIWLVSWEVKDYKYFVMDMVTYPFILLK